MQSSGFGCGPRTVSSSRGTYITLWNRARRLTSVRWTVLWETQWGQLDSLKALLEPRSRVLRVGVLPPFSELLCPIQLGCRLGASRGVQDSYLVDSASSHMLVSKIKPCMSKYKQLYRETANGSLYKLSFI